MRLTGTEHSKANKKWIGTLTPNTSRVGIPADGMDMRPFLHLNHGLSSSTRASLQQVLGAFQESANTLTHSKAFILKGSIMHVRSYKQPAKRAEQLQARLEVSSREARCRRCTAELSRSCLGDDGSSAAGRGSGRPSSSTSTCCRTQHGPFRMLSAAQDSCNIICPALRIVLADASEMR